MFNTDRLPFLALMMALAGGIALGSTAFAQTMVMTIAVDETAINHYPGPDGLIGNADDVVSGDPTAANQSGANAMGSLGHNSFSFSGAGPGDPALPTGFDAITFVRGTVTADIGVLGGGNGPIVSAMDITSGTEPFPGHGAYTSTITAVNGGTYNAATGAFTLDVDFNYTIGGNVSAEPGVELTGTAIYVEADDFGNATGNAYVDNVAVPLAQQNGASSVLFITGTGTLTNLGYPINTTIVALDTGQAFVINQGMSDAWFNDETAGQGFLIVVLPDQGIIFLAWFTYDTERPPEDVIALLGEPGHRWVTAQGPYDGDTATLTVYLTQGGVFDMAEPPAVTDTENPIGTITIVWHDCESATLTYDIDPPGVSGEIALRRIVPDNAILCEALMGE